MVGIVRKHWFLVVPRVLEFAIIISLLIIFANKYIQSSESDVIMTILIACLFIYLIYAWVLLRVDYYVITSDRIIKINHKGIWNRNLNEVLISDIGNIVLIEKGIAASFLGFGTVNITLKESGVFNMTNIIDPIKVYQGLIKLKGIKKE